MKIQYFQGNSIVRNDQIRPFFFSLTAEAKAVGRSSAVPHLARTGMPGTETRWRIMGGLGERTGCQSHRFCYLTTKKRVLSDEKHSLFDVP